MPFSTELVPRVLDGSKTQTRRVIRAFKESAVESYSYEEIVAMNFRKGRWWFETEYGKEYPYRHVVPVVGDQLWIKEAWCNVNRPSVKPEVYYKADALNNSVEDYDPSEWPWKSGRFMPKWAARPLRLEIMNVRAQRVRDISESDAKAEGVMLNENSYPARSKFMELWNKLNAKRGYGWKANPWVWIYEWPPVTS